MEREERGAWLRLMLTPGLGNVGTRRLLITWGSAPAVFDQPVSALSQVVPGAVAQALLQADAAREAQIRATEDWLQSGPDHHLLTLGQAQYPGEFLEMADPPLLLYARGQLDTLSWPLKLAVVGSRNPSPQGLLNARQLAAGLGQAGACVVSGLALGIDAAAHEGALLAAARTVAVVGTGLDRVYPRQHDALAGRIAAQGLVLSEYPLGTPPLSQNFPKRNRLIAALSQGTLVVEAALKSGSLITARLAVELGREVFAVPGSIHSPQARGCHWLIRQGAKLVESAQDVLEELRPQVVIAPAPVAATAELFPAAGAASAALVDHTTHAALLAALGHDPVGLDALQARTGLPTATLQAQLLELELAGSVGRLPGGLFQRVASA